MQGQLNLGGRSSRAPIALVTLAARPTILRITAAQRHAAGKPGPRGPGTHANRRARAGRPAQSAAGGPGPASAARQDAVNGHDVMNGEASQNGTAGQNI